LPSPWPNPLLGGRACADAQHADCIGKTRRFLPMTSCTVAPWSTRNARATQPALTAIRMPVQALRRAALVEVLPTPGRVELRWFETATSGQVLHAGVDGPTSGRMHGPKYLPTVHGFDEFFGNLHHLNAEEEPENPDYPKDPKFREKFGPRGVMRSWATDNDDPTVEPRWGRVGNGCS
jgi:hypothetical protein